MNESDERRDANGDEDEAAMTRRERWLVCKACGARIVPDRARELVDGKHEHEIESMSGGSFTLSCWSLAPGCEASGERSTEWTWFPGFTGQPESCRMCSKHLGWSFHGTRTFYGLILDRLG